MKGCMDPSPAAVVSAAAAGYASPHLQNLMTLAIMVRITVMDLGTI